MSECPQCKSPSVVSGTLTSADEKSGVVFRPENTKFWSFSIYGGPVLKGKSHGCLDCGLIWSSGDAQELANFVKKNCQPQAGESA
jgi:hypothetical protein